jgi:hypothetical protein
MKIKKNGEIINLTESDLKRIVKKSLLKEDDTNVRFADLERLEKDEAEIKSVEERLSLLEKEVHGNMDAERFGDRSLQEQIQWINSGMDELSNTVSRILKHIKL